MPNLVGIGNSQVPTNAMLGGMAYQDSTNVVLDTVEPGKVRKIRKTSGLLSPYEANGSGEVAFVYDTSKDSDGGAWRKKTQNTSWYNEKVSTYRGSRKEFPSIAIITSSQASVDIYDGDDPNLSLWMSFRVGNPYVIGCNDDWPSCISMKNGMLVVGEHRNYGGVNIIDFVKDEIRRLRGSITSNGTNGMWPTGIWGRNGNPDINTALWATGRGYDNYNIGRIHGDNINSVAIFAHDNSPRDRVTGLPYPTVAVACATGISIISARHFEMISYSGGMGNTGSGGNAIYDLSCSNASFSVGRSVEWNEFGDLIFVLGDGNGDADYIHTFDQHSTQEAEAITIDTKGFTTTRVRNMYRGNYNHTISNVTPALSGPWIFSGYLSQGSNRQNTDNTHQHKVNHLAAMKGYQFAASTRNGLTQIVENPNAHWANNSTGSSLIAYTGHSFTSGWTYGRAGIITLCTTDDTNIVSNNNLISDTAGNWSTYSGSGTVSNPSSGVLRIVDNDNQYGVKQDITTVTGKTYVFTCHATSARYMFVRIFNGGSQIADNNTGYGGTGNGIGINVTFVAQSTTTTVVLSDGSGGSYTCDIEDLQFRLAERDYSVYDASASVIGTITKGRVNGNSDLCYYTGWSSSNHIWKYHAGRPTNYEDGLDHGNGDFYYNFWINPQDSASGTAIFSKSTDNNGMYTRCYFNGDDVRFDLSTSGSGYQGFQAGGNHFVQESYAWTCVMGIRRDRHFEIWVNGKLELRNAITVGSVMTDSFSSNDHVLKIGYDPNTGSSDASLRLSLFRSGFGAPSKEQIEKMYFDERPLFGPDAKCTLVGSTNDHIEALDYDSHTDLLHVGGSQGRADFSGLVRINNNTTAITRALSAEKGMIAEY